MVNALSDISAHTSFKLLFVVQLHARDYVWTVLIIIIPNNARQRAKWREQFWGKAAVVMFFRIYMHVSKVILTAADDFFHCIINIQSQTRKSKWTSTSLG